MKNENITSSFKYVDNSHMEHHSVLLPRLEKILNDINPTLGKTKRIFDLGCGNGSMASVTNKGWDMTGVDPSNDGMHKFIFPESQTIQWLDG